MEKKIEFFKLFQRKSSGGRTYFQGRLGGARVIVFKDDRTEVDGDTVAVWTVYLQHRDPDRANNRTDRQHAPPAKQATAQQPARPKARPAPAKRSIPEATKRAIEDINARFPGNLNDELPRDL